MRSVGSAYTVLGDDGQAATVHLRGKLRLSGVRTTNPIAVGDRVEYADGAITAILPRKNYIIRRASNLSKESHILAANIDRAVLVTTLVHPEVRTEFIDRFLVTCEAYAIPAVIALNKSDLGVSPDEFIHAYTLAGYSVVPVSALAGDLGELPSLLRGRTTLVAGNSGVGKSTLIKALVPDLDIRMGDISSSHLKGRHTTTHATMYGLPGGGFIIDTPGVKGFGLIEIAPRELARYYPEMLARVSQCRFPNCTHVHEPGCAVIAAVDKGQIAPSRYISYLKTLDEHEKYRK